MKRTTIMAEEELLYKIERIARNSGQPKAKVIREALAEYVVRFEEENPPENPLLSIVGIAGTDAPPTDVSDGKDEEMLREGSHLLYGWSARESEATHRNGRNSI